MTLAVGALKYTDVAYILVDPAQQQCAAHLSRTFYTQKIRGLEHVFCLMSALSCVCVA